ncbi:hypothetical protein [Argonema antarcticum]|uniref:hypothetical protein n=1 Tax=Argonema antarcticum TaxID=2942763 RepID=UPI002011A84A|nr:hypothetical protein [Argonema antarcticum]MCL1473268.1 hypothetical protein [Argonema antarcticum A004/B2]
MFILKPKHSALSTLLYFVPPTQETRFLVLTLKLKWRNYVETTGGSSLFFGNIQT